MKRTIRLVVDSVASFLLALLAAISASLVLAGSIEAADHQVGQVFVYVHDSSVVGATTAPAIDTSTGALRGYDDRYNLARTHTRAELRILAAKGGMTWWEQIGDSASGGPREGQLRGWLCNRAGSR